MFSLGSRVAHHLVLVGNLLNRGAALSSCSKLFVGGLSYDTNEIALRDAFSQHGDVVEVKVICHPVTGKSKGYGFVKFSSEIEAAAALEKMSDELLDGLSYDTNQIAVKDAFSQHSDLTEVRVMCHPVTGRSKGYGFIKFSSETEAAAALKKMSDEES